MKACAQVGDLPARDQVGALAQRGAHLAVDVVQALAVDQRAHLHIGLGQRVDQSNLVKKILQCGNLHANLFQSKFLHDASSSM